MNTLKIDRRQIFEAPTHEQIQARAYELYLARGAYSGHEQEDWLQAEQELTDAVATAPVAQDQPEPSNKKDHRGDRDHGRNHRGANGDRTSQRH